MGKATNNLLLGDKMENTISFFFPFKRALTYKRTIFPTSGFWPRVRARALCAPVFLGLLTRKTGALRATVHRSFAASDLLPKNFPQARTRAARGVLYIFPLG